MAVSSDVKLEKDVKFFHQIFNMGDTANNYQVKDIAEIVASIFKGCKVSFSKIAVQTIATIGYLLKRLTKFYLSLSTSGMLREENSSYFIYSHRSICSEEPSFLEVFLS
jgi:hypothetical protein